MDKNPQEQEQSTSKRNFHWSAKVGNEEDEQTLTSISEKQSKSIFTTEEQSKSKSKRIITPQNSQQNPHKNLSSIAVSHLKSVLATFNRNILHRKNPNFLGSKVVGTLFGHRKGHVHFAFQMNPTSIPAFLIELATPISGLVKEMASGLVRIALECDKKTDHEKKEIPVKKLLEEDGTWRTYCNGKKCGFAIRRECGEKELKILKAVEPISMGVGVLPGEKTGDKNNGDDEDDGEIMYMRAIFERIVGSRDSEAFYMMNPDSNVAPELSIYLLRS